MTILRSSILLSFGMLLTTATAASAGGDLMLPEDMEPVAAYSDEPVYAPQRKIYLRGDIGVGAHDDPEIIQGYNVDLADEEIDETFTVGLGIGRYFTRNIRGDITVDYRSNATVSAFMPSGTFLGNTQREHDLSSLVVLANLYYDFASYTPAGGKGLGLRQSRFTPYVGVGLGFVNHWSDEGSFSGCCSGTIGDNSEASVAAAFMAGVGINVRNHWKIDAGYRFLYMGDFHTGYVVANGGSAPGAGTHKVEDLHAHEFRLGLRYDLR